MKNNENTFSSQISLNKINKNIGQIPFSAVKKNNFLIHKPVSKSLKRLEPYFLLINDGDQFKISCTTLDD